MESEEFTRARVKLFKKGFSQDEITQIFETLDSPNDLTNFRKIVDKTYQLMNDSVSGNSQTLPLIEEFVKFFMANQLEDVNSITVTATRKGRKWLFIVGAS